MRRVAVVLVALAALAAGATAVRAPLQRDDRRLWRIVGDGIASLGGSGGGSPVGNPDAGNVIFVTSSIYTGNMGGLSGADTICINHAADAGLAKPSTFIALLNTSTQTAYARLPIAGGFVRPDGKPVAASRDQLFSGYIWYQPNLDEHGRLTPYDAADAGALVFSGLIDGGTGASGACSDWASTSGNGAVGDAYRGGDRWFERVGITCGCDQPRPIYCASNNGAVVPDSPVRAPRLAFTSRTLLSGTGTLQAMDQACQNEAIDAGLSGTFIALVAPDAGTAPALRIDGGASNWSRVDGTAMTSSSVALLDAGFWWASLTLDARGVFNPQTVWSSSTVADPYVDTGSLNCVGWAGPTVGNNWAGTSTSLGSGLASPAAGIYQSAVTAACSNTLAVPCFQTDVLPDAGYHFCDALAQGDRVGTWGCVNGDGTATPGDNLGPWVPGGAPVKYGGTTCSAPSYSTLNGATPDYYTSTVSVGSAPSAMSWCALLQDNTSLKSGFYWGAYPCCSSYAVTIEEAAILKEYFSGGTPVNSASSLGTEKTLVCGSWSGGTGYFYIRNSSIGSTFYSGATSLNPVSGQKFTFGADGTSSVTGKFFGGFYTEKQLAQADFDAIYTATVGASCL